VNSLSSSRYRQEEIDRLNWSTPFTERDSTYYSKLNTLEFHRDIDLRREREEERKRLEKQKGEEETALRAAADDFYERRRRQARKAAIFFLNNKKEGSADPLTMVYEKNILLVSKKLMLDRMIAQVMEILGEETVLDHLEKVIAKSESYSAEKVYDKYRDVILSRGKTANVEI